MRGFSARSTRVCSKFVLQVLHRFRSQTLLELARGFACHSDVMRQPLSMHEPPIMSLAGS